MSTPEADAATDPAVASREPAGKSGDELRVRGVIETALYCPDLEAAERFYTEVLNFEVFARDEGRHLFFRCGDGMLLLFNPQHTSTTVTEVGDAKMPLHGHDGAGHTAFRAGAEEIEHWKERLVAHGVAIESEIAWPEGGNSIFFRDPAGNVLEFTTPITWGLER
ncbi:MAG: VOC family protein [Acidobacteriota bacterium]|jgi:catechol 2,3-dioxygenase-like lactoylglutathione lyase family enzyme